MAASSIVIKKLDRQQPQSAGEPPPPPIPTPPSKKQWKCANCAKEETPVKRSGPQGPGTLCNACGLRVRKERKAAVTAATADTRIPQRRAKQKKKPPPIPKKSQKRTRDGELPPPKKHRSDTGELNNVHHTAVPPPSTTSPLTARPSVVAVPSQHVRAANPVSSKVANGIVVQMPSAALPDSASSRIRAAPSVSARTISTLPPSKVSSMVTPAPVGVVTSASMAPPASFSKGVSSPSGIHCPIRGQESLSPAPPRLAMPPAAAEANPTGAPGIPAANIVAPAAIKAATSSGSLSPSPIPGAPPATPEIVPLMQSATPPDAVGNLLPQCMQAEEIKVNEIKVNEILRALEMCPATIEAGPSESVNWADQDVVPGIMFASACDSTGTGSTQLDVLEMLGGIKGGSTDLPPGTSMVSVDVPYWDSGSIAAPVGSMVAPVGSMVAPVGSMAAPIGSMAAPVGSMAAPIGSMAAPIGATAAPIGSMAAPVGSMAAPIGSMAAPIGSMAGPATSIGALVPDKEVEQYMHTLTELGRLNSGIDLQVKCIDQVLAFLVKKHERISMKRNMASSCISQLLAEKDSTSQEQRETQEKMARMSCIVDYLRK